MYGRTLTPETIAKLRKANQGENHPFYGKTHSEETLAKISKARGTTVYVYSSDKFSLIYTFPSSRNAAKHFNCSFITILRYIKSAKLFKEKYILSINRL
jgi:group I intron endonuclease